MGWQVGSGSIMPISLYGRVSIYNQNRVVTPLTRVMTGTYGNVPAPNTSGWTTAPAGSKNLIGQFTKPDNSRVVEAVRVPIVMPGSESSYTLTQMASFSKTWSAYVTTSFRLRTDNLLTTGRAVDGEFFGFRTNVFNSSGTGYAVRVSDATPSGAGEFQFLGQYLDVRTKKTVDSIDMSLLSPNADSALYADIHLTEHLKHTETVQYELDPQSVRVTLDFDCNRT